jgi:hypothetical protein
VGKWKSFSINVTDDEMKQLKALAGLKGMSVTAFIKYLLKIHLDANAPIMWLIEQARDKVKTG